MSSPVPNSGTTTVHVLSGGFLESMTSHEHGQPRYTRATVVALLNDWETGLSRSLYQEACFHLFGGKEQCWQFAETFWDDRQTGRQPVKVLDEGIAFEITCVRGDLAAYASHLDKIVSNTNLEAILSANIISNVVRFEQIGKEW